MSDLRNEIIVEAMVQRHRQTGLPFDEIARSAYIMKVGMDYDRANNQRMLDKHLSALAEEDGREL